MFPTVSHFVFLGKYAKVHKSGELCFLSSCINSPDFYFCFFCFTWTARHMEYPDAGKPAVLPPFRVAYGLGSHSSEDTAHTHPPAFRHLRRAPLPGFPDQPGRRRILDHHEKNTPVIIIKADLIHIQNVQRKIRYLFGDDSVILHLCKVPHPFEQSVLPDVACLANAFAISAAPSGSMPTPSTSADRSTMICSSPGV